MSVKFFAVDEAERLIPKLEQILLTLMENRKSAIEISDELLRMQKEVKSKNAKSVDASDLVNKKTELDFLIRIINEGLDSIAEMGAQPKDLDVGLVDFPTMLDGEMVLLCWKLGEKEINYYHGITDGYARRKPLIRNKQSGLH